MKLRKILYSPAYGAGWTSWADRRDIKQFMLTYQPIIDYLEAGNDFKGIKLDKIYDRAGKPTILGHLPACLQQFVADCQERFGEVPYLAGARDLEIEEVNCLVKITDFDGYEHIKYCNEDWI